MVDSIWKAKAVYDPPSTIHASASAVGYIIEATLSPGYSSMHRTISDLELVKHGWTQSVNFILLGIFTCLFAIGLRKELESGTGAKSLPALQLLVALGLILTGGNIHPRTPAHAKQHDLLHFPGDRFFSFRKAISRRWTVERLGSLFHPQRHTHDGFPHPVRPL